MGQDNAELIAEARSVLADMETRQEYDDCFARVVDALERVTPRVVTEVAELEALEVGTVIRQSPDDVERVEPDDGTWEQGAVAELRRDASGRPAWFLVGHELGWRSHQVGILPATVLFTPTGKETE